jgi:hypothetical protein
MIARASFFLRLVGDLDALAVDGNGVRPLDGLGRRFGLQTEQTLYHQGSSQRLDHWPGGFGQDCGDPVADPGLKVAQALHGRGRSCLGLALEPIRGVRHPDPARCRSPVNWTGSLLNHMGQLVRQYVVTGRGPRLYSSRVQDHIVADGVGGGPNRLG